MNIKDMHRSILARLYFVEQFVSSQYTLDIFTVQIVLADRVRFSKCSRENIHIHKVAQGWVD